MKTMNMKYLLEHTVARIDKRRWNQNIPLIVMFIPVVLFFIVFKYVPMFGLIIAFKHYNFTDGIFNSPWTGLTNFQIMFSNPQMVNIIKNTFLLSLLNLVFGFPLPIVFAILLNEVRNVLYKRFVQTLVYLPHFLNWVIVGGFAVLIFAQNGIVNQLMNHWFGFSYSFLYQPFSWITIFVSAGVWKTFGWGAIIYLAALTAINPSLYEAASIDGASRFRQIWHITLPGLRPTIILLFILSMGNLMEVGFDQVYVLQNPVVSQYSEVISTWSYKVGLGNMQFSMAAALGLFESLIGLVFVLTANRIARRFNESIW